VRGQDRDVGSRGVPDDVPIDGTVGVDGSVAKTDDQPPIDLPMSVTQELWDSRSGFADDRELHKGGIPPHGIAKDGVFGLLVEMRCDLVRAATMSISRRSSRRLIQHPW
jgi:hypothetical protein